MLETTPSMTDLRDFMAERFTAMTNNTNGILDTMERILERMDERNGPIIRAMDQISNAMDARNGEIIQAMGKISDAMDAMDARSGEIIRAMGKISNAMDAMDAMDARNGEIIQAMKDKMGEGTAEVKAMEAGTGRQKKKWLLTAVGLGGLLVGGLALRMRWANWMILLCYQSTTYIPTSKKEEGRL